MSNLFIHFVERKPARLAGLLRYFNGKPCPKGHISERFTSSGGCVVCAAEMSASSKKKEYDKIYYGKNKERIKIRGAAYNKKHSEQKCKQAREWAKNNPDKRKIICANYSHARRAKIKSGCTFAEVYAWAQSQAKICYWCGCSCESSYHIDHYYSLAGGGKHEIENLVISCKKCNLRKSSKDPIKWAQENGRLL